MLTWFIGFLISFAILICITLYLANAFKEDNDEIGPIGFIISVVAALIWPIGLPVILFTFIAWKLFWKPSE